MTLEELREVCLEFPASREEVKWENDLCFLIGKKMFAVVSLDKTPVSASFKASPEEFEYLTDQPGFSPAPYLARYNWVYIEDISTMGTSQWQELVTGSYTLVRDKLPTKIRKSLGL